jgi:hypothetical protein
MTKKPATKTDQVEEIDEETGEITTGTAVATVEDADDFSGGLTEYAVQVKKFVSLTTLQFKDGMTIIARFLTPIVEGKELKAGARGPRMGKAYITTIQSRSGEMRTLVAGTVLRSEIAENYPDGSYVGAWFQITKHPPREDKGNYATYTITEIYPPKGAVEVPLDSVAAAE